MGQPKMVISEAIMIGRVEGLLRKGYQVVRRLIIATVRDSEGKELKWSEDSEEGQEKLEGRSNLNTLDEIDLALSAVAAKE
jgi:hypothetical protein